jgi:PPOX class probable F420-dependent enzyme
MTIRIDVADRLTDENRAWLAAELRYPVMATLDSAGNPKQSVVWYDFAPEGDDIILVNSRNERLKTKHLRRDPRVSLLFEDGWQYLAVEGRARVVEDPIRGMADIKALAVRYGSDPETFNGQDRRTFLIRIDRVIWHP